MKILCLDFETKDPTLKKYGMGWCFKHHFPEIEFDILGCGLFSCDIEKYIDFSKGHLNETLENIISQYDAILCHNAMYDLGCLYYLYDGEEVYKDKLILDTMLMAKQITQHLDSYSLENLAKHYVCGEQKGSNMLHDFAWESGLYQKCYFNNTGINKKIRPSVVVLERFCKENLNLFSSNIVGQYCIQDCKATMELCDKLMSSLDMELIEKDSSILKACVKIKATGIRIDLNKTKKLKVYFNNIAKESAANFKKELEAPEDFNINSNKQLAEQLIKFGYKLPQTENGNSSLRSTWLEEQPDEVFHELKRYRKALKVKKDFLQKLEDYQEIIPEQYKENNIGWLFPTLKPYGATLTGRFSSGGGQGCLELNIQQIPARDPEFGEPIRELFLPHKGEQLIVGDFSSQEPRIQTHYAELLGCTGGKILAQKYRDNPNLKIYDYLSKEANINKADAKTIHLGLSYGMFKYKLADQLNVPLSVAEELLNKYYNTFSWMAQIQKITSKNLLKLGYIKTIGGRKLRIDPPYIYKGKMRTNESKAFSKLIQGSAADQTREAIIDLYKKGAKIIFSVHDEIGISSNSAEEDKSLLEDSMCNSIKLNVPMYVEAKIGKNWREVK